MRCIQYGIFAQAAFKNARTMFFPKLGRACLKFQSGSKNLKKIMRCLSPYLPPLPKFIGGTLASAPKWSVTNQWKADDKKLQKSEKGPPDSGICFWLRSCGLIGGPAMGKQAIFPWREDRLQNLYNVLATYRCKVLANFELGNEDVALYTLTI